MPVPGRGDAGRIRERQRRAVLYEQFYNAADANLFLVAEGLEPSGELVGAFNVPRHRQIMP